MSTGKHAVMLLARCGRAFWPTSAAARKNIVNSRITVHPVSYRAFSDQSDPPKSAEDSFEFPKLPLSPLKHFIQCAKSFGAFTAAAQKLDLEVETVGQLQSAAKEVLVFLTQRLSEEDYDAVSERLTPVCLKEISSVVSSLPENQKKLFTYDCSRLCLLDHVYPWACRKIYFDSMQRMEMTYCVLQVLINGTQIVWGLSMLIPEHGGSSEEWKVSRLHFQIAMSS